MQPPTAREARLETLLNERDSQISELHASSYTVHYRSSVSSTSGLLYFAFTAVNDYPREENDELYELLRYSETGKLKEEVRGLRRLVQRLQNSLRQSHETINLLSRELDKSYEAYLSVAQPAPSPQPSPRTYPPSPRANYTTPASGNGSHGSKLPPTGPRKRPRLSESNSHPFTNSGKSHSTSSHNHYAHNPAKRGADGHPKRNDKDNRGGSDANKGSRPSKMDVDNERPVPSEPARGRDKNTDREFDRDRGRDRDRGPKDQDHSRDRDRGPNSSNRRGGSGRGGGRRDRPGGSAFHGAGNTSNNAYNVNGDRTLAERMGL
ncbi:hypothetical protein AN958_10279 [Leucoagaricus sp. SymC.cos]|nr:hypothetical protein AN958_10279 [Leucoagaricus sp. SymC.cos]